jgi:hypothetical protein
MRNDVFLHFGGEIEVLFASSSLKYLPNVRITPKSKTHVQNSDCHWCRREKDFALYLAKDFGAGFASIAGLSKSFFLLLHRPDQPPQSERLAISHRRFFDEHQNFLDTHSRPK